MLARLERLEQLLEEERQARLALAAEMAQLGERVDEDHDEVLEIVGALGTRVQEAEQLFDAGMQQTSSIEAQLHKLEAHVAQDLGVRSGPGRSQGDLTSSGNFTAALRSNSAEELEESIRKASAPRHRARHAGSRAAREEHTTVASSTGGLMGQETAEAICEAFASVIKELRANVDKMNAAGIDTSAVTALEQNHHALRRDMQMRSESLGEGVSNVLEQLELISKLAVQTDALQQGHDETISRVQRLELKLTNDNADTQFNLESRCKSLQSGHDRTQKLFSQLDQKVTDSL